MQFREGDGSRRGMASLNLCPSHPHTLSAPWFLTPSFHRPYIQMGKKNPLTGGRRRNPNVAIPEEISGIATDDRCFFNAEGEPRRGHGH